MDTNQDTDTRFDTTLVIGSNGHVWVCKEARYDGVWLHMVHARIVRVWGTTRGLNELVNGPLTETVLDAPADIVSLFHTALIAVIPASEYKWQEALA